MMALVINLHEHPKFIERLARIFMGKESDGGASAARKWLSRAVPEQHWKNVIMRVREIKKLIGDK